MICLNVCVKLSFFLSPSLQEVIKLVQPVFLGKLIRYFENYDPNNMDALHEAYGYAAGVSFSVLGLALMHHLYFFHVQRAGMKFRIAMCHMIYRKVWFFFSSLVCCLYVRYDVY